MLTTRRASNHLDLKKCFPVMSQLRPHLQEDSFVEQALRQMAQGYQLIYVEDKGQVHAVAGFRVQEFLAWGKILYVDDLITGSTSRRQGHASTLLKWIIAHAKEQNCNEVHLDSGHQRHEAHRFYLNHGMLLKHHHFVLKL